MADMSKECTFTRKNDPKYVDLLDEDQSLAGQKFVCLSFISPEKVLKDKNLFLFEEFMKQYDMYKSLEKFTQFLNFVAYKYKVPFDKLQSDLEDFAKSEANNIFNISLDAEYKTFIDNNEEKLEEKFNKDNKFQTSTRGLKVRGCFPSEQEAEMRCKILREMDPNHDIMVGPVGMWVPWHPDAYKTGKVEYLEEELNELMNEKQKNEKSAKLEFDKRIKDAKRQAMEDNIQKAKDSGNVLTQTLNKDGELVNVKDVVSSDNSLLKQGEMSTKEEIRDTLFNTENVVTGQTDHGYSELADVKAAKQQEANE
ncbi:hypothetical protein ceV_203 [Chrysochromulina ericina virus CeV-01B]|jgi:hypothetical protein|uniref:Uncharacterized protein n=1 Tax=Chrysochromulina ericina virus CeV-01B TaxID=3070830 RepID=A0A0N9R3B9_9VIRU|nr:hypothetical protein ceV_203 [Chrysochromulina ericina virus]ALH23109.1 hypothetical protein ceV_203 [Chrysochromulina ericina virus CeV-01B]|tara:strand:- start:4110 stop:5039 length:930 start_codon:yes stop_codon:yes gene_type:complete